jgi:hypothetical protein
VNKEKDSEANERVERDELKKSNVIEEEEG